MVFVGADFIICRFAGYSFIVVIYVARSLFAAGKHTAATLMVILVIRHTRFAA